MCQKKIVLIEHFSASHSPSDFSSSSSSSSSSSEIMQIQFDKIMCVRRRRVFVNAHTVHLSRATCKSNLYAVKRFVSDIRHTHRQAEFYYDSVAGRENICHTRASDNITRCERSEKRQEKQRPAGRCFDTRRPDILPFSDGARSGAHVCSFASLASSFVGVAAAVVAGQKVNRHRALSLCRCADLVV